MIIKAIVSGGQTGADRGGLDAALRFGFPCFGYCPRGRLAEDGPIPPRYPMIETEADSYPLRTEANARVSTATIIFFSGARTPGVALTARLCKQLARPACAVDLLARGVEATQNDANYVIEVVDKLVSWMDRKLTGDVILNIAGSRESKAPGIQVAVDAIVTCLIGRRGVPVPQTLAPGGFRAGERLQAAKQFRDIDE